MDPDGVGQEIEEARVGRGARQRAPPFVARGGLNVLCVAGDTVYVVPGLTFHGDDLLAVGGVSSQTLRIDPNTALVTVVGPTTAAPGGGIATDPDTGTVYYATSTTSALRILDPATGTTTNGPTLNGATYDLIAAMTFFEGTLYAVDKASGPGTGADLVSIDTATGAITRIMALPLDTNALVNGAH